MSPEPYQYPGDELDVFAHARNWKRYWVSRVREFLTGDVLEVGAGIGSNTALMLRPEVRSWICLEPDARLLERLARRLAADPAMAQCRAVRGTVASLDPSLTFDAIAYVDVLEHIEADREELRAAAAHLKPGGHLVVLAPAHNGLYTAFDKAIGHVRRYSKSSLLDLTPPGTTVARAFYLDSAGLLASGANRFLLKSAMPTAGQVRLWDRMIVPISRILDPLTAHAMGKSVVVVWRRMQ
jgi:SAM-dependent methyltransferase